MLAKIVFSISCLILFGPYVMNAQESAEFHLSDYKWQNRLLLIFSPSQKDLRYQKQLKALKGKEDDFEDRDMKIFHLKSSGKSFVDEQEVNPSDIEKLHKKYEVTPNNFVVILIGKDGTEKLRTDSVLAVKKLSL